MQLYILFIQNSLTYKYNTKVAGGEGERHEGVEVFFVGSKTQYSRVIFDRDV